jgi:hypothetical protein
VHHETISLRIGVPRLNFRTRVVLLAVALVTAIQLNLDSTREYTEIASDF